MSNEMPGSQRRGQTRAAKKRAGKKKPAVAFESADLALKNIRLKLLLIRQTLDGKGPFIDSTGEVNLELIPISVRKFNSWNKNDLGEQFVDVPSFVSNANATLNKHPAELASLKSALSAVSNIVKAIHLQRPTRDQNVARLRDESRLQRTLREIAERELMSMSKQLTKLKNEVVLLKTQISSQAEEARQQFEKSSKDSDGLRAQNAALTKTVRKVTTLKRHVSSGL